MHSVLHTCTVDAIYCYCELDMTVPYSKHCLLLDFDHLHLGTLRPKQRQNLKSTSQLVGCLDLCFMYWITTAQACVV